MIILPLRLKYGTFVLKPGVLCHCWGIFGGLGFFVLFVCLFLMSSLIQIRKSKENSFVIIQKNRLSTLFNNAQIPVSRGMLSANLAMMYMSMSQKYHSLVSVV